MLKRYIFGLIIIVVLLFSPTVSNAQTSVVESLQSQINSVLEQIQKLQTLIDQLGSIVDAEILTLNNTPVITSISGPLSLQVNEVGVWTVEAYDIEDSQLTFSVFWGDGWSDTAQTALFTHSYSKTGIYSILWTVTDSDGQFMLERTYIIVQ